MKKLLICFTILMSFVGINRVSADMLELSHSDTLENGCSFYVTDYDYLKELGFDNELQEIYKLLLEEYNANYSSQYPYYYLDVVVMDSQNCNHISSFNSVGNIQVFLNLYTELPLLNTIEMPDSDLVVLASYDVSKETYILPSVSSGYTHLKLLHYSLSSSSGYYNPMAYFISNFDLYYNGSDSYLVTGNSNFEINSGVLIQPVFSVDNAFQDNYTEINLNDYAFVALSLKDYNQEAFTSTIQVKGEYCVNAVYDYGLSSKEKYDSSITDVCSPYYDNYTPVRHYVLENDIKNHAIYYIKAHDTSKENKIKVDSSIFNVHYITEEEADNPVININGRDYSILPFDELPTNSIKNTDDGFVPGESEKFSFSDIFTEPLDFLKDVWGAIVNVFDLVKELFSLLPEPMSTFLIISFTLAIILGLIKIIL